MDPDAALEVIRRCAGKIQKAVDEGDEPDYGLVGELASTVLVLDQWLRRGGFLPFEWEADERHEVEL